MSSKLLIISGPSGAGKTSLKKRLINNPKILVGFSPSDTTRERRENEVHGVDYNFTTEVEMKEGIDRGEFYETVVYNGQIYGTRKQSVKNVIDDGKICILDMAVDGVRQYKAYKKTGEEALEAQYVFVKPPSLEVLERRLRDRKTETEETLQNRMKIAQEELQYGEQPGNFDLVITNDNQDEAYDQLLNFLEKNFCQQE